MKARTVQQPVVFMPGVTVDDPLAAHWLRQVTLRLRREVCWLWHERGVHGKLNEDNGQLPPFIDPLVESLDLSRHDKAKRQFFLQDKTGAYLTKMIDKPVPKKTGTMHQGSFSWLIRKLQLSPLDCFVLALALSGAVDSANGSVFAACQNDPNRILPTPALTQRLWDNPVEVLALMESDYTLTAAGLLQHPPGDWGTPLQVPSILIQQLLFPVSYRTGSVEPVTANGMHSRVIDRDVHVSRLRSHPEHRVSIIPVTGPGETAVAEACADIAEAADLKLLRPAALSGHIPLASLLTMAWLHQSAILIPAAMLLEHMEHTSSPAIFQLPVIVFVVMDKEAKLSQLPATLTLPALHVPGLSYSQRLHCWQQGIKELSASHLQPVIADCARRFRYEAEAIGLICSSLAALQRPLEASDFYHACRSDVELGDLAQPVLPRFRREELMLPKKQSSQIDELIQAVHSLTTVHYEWGTANAWNEGGLSVLFSGPPGTGKTMAAEVIANTVDMPLYRIDLSQVVNKYIGETEKNLRTLFDAGDKSDVILFFDEADALFGKRTEVKDAHDRYANLEVSYLLERMERFKGIAILASNRKKDLDEAFLRRLRYVIDFPMPGVEERKRIWQYTIPDGVDSSSLNLEYLSERISLSGGHIRSVVFNACLQSDHQGEDKVLRMEVLVRSLKRELDKLSRTTSLEQFGPYARFIEEEL